MSKEVSVLLENKEIAVNETFVVADFNMRDIKNFCLHAKVSSNGNISTTVKLLASMDGQNFLPFEEASSSGEDIFHDVTKFLPPYLRVQIEDASDEAMTYDFLNICFDRITSGVFPFVAETEGEVIIQGAEMLIIHGIVSSADIIGKTTGQTIDLVGMPANARVVRAYAGCNQAMQGLVTGPTIQAFLRTNNNQDAFANSLGDRKLSEWAPYQENISLDNGSGQSWYTEAVPFTLQLELSSDAAGFEVGEDLQYWVEYVQE